jgi:hypothetical protein
LLRAVEDHSLRQEATVASDHDFDRIARDAPTQRGLHVRPFDAAAPDGDDLVAGIDACAPGPGIACH